MNSDFNQLESHLEELGYAIVASRSDKHPDYGYPLGQILCRSLVEAKEYIEKSEFTDCYIKE